MVGADEICWTRVCDPCDCDGSWVKSEEFWFSMMEEVTQLLYKFFYFKSEGDKHFAKDCVQETLIRFYKSVESNAFDHRKKLEPYLWSIARNYWYTQLRKSYKSKLTVSLDYVESRGQKDPGLTEAEKLEAQMAKFKALTRRAGLSKFQLTLLILHYFDDLKPKEIAVLLNVPAKRVIDGLYRARIKIKEVIIDQQQIRILKSN